MSKYTTGEIAKLCGVSVRTVQYYDSRNILTPSELSDGGRRLYSEEDLQRLRIICFLRELDLSINSIGELLSEENPENIISVLLDEQEKMLCTEIAEKQSRLDKLKKLKQSLKRVENFSFDSIGDVARIMGNKKKLRKIHTRFIAVGIVMDIIEISTLVVWLLTGIWWPFAVGMCAVLSMSVWISNFYFKGVAYICPQCHTVFKPSFKQAFWAKHTLNTRKLTCRVCGHHGYCVETCANEETANE